MLYTIITILTILLERMRDERRNTRGPIFQERESWNDPVQYVSSLGCDIYKALSELARTDIPDMVKGYLESQTDSFLLLANDDTPFYSMEVWLERTIQNLKTYTKYGVIR